MHAFPPVDQRLVAAVRLGLLPHRFPTRRDVEAAGAVSAGGAYDLFWPCPDRLALVAYRARPAGMPGALAMAAFRQLLRAAAALFASAEDAVARALAALEQVHAGIELDLAVVIFDLPAVRASFAVRGVAYAGPVAGGAGSSSLLTAAVGVSIPPVIPDDAMGDALDVRIGMAVAGPSGIEAIAALQTLSKVPDAADLLFVIDNQSAAIGAALVEIERRCDEAGMDPAASGLLALVIDEMVTNVVSYAYGDGEAHEIIVRVHLENGSARVAIEDDGRPFDPLAAAVPDFDADVEERPLGGLGVHFLKTAARDVAYERRRGWNVLRFTVAPSSLPNMS